MGMRGEKYPISGQAVLQLGSPPHARGKEAHPEFEGSQIRITPACAGKSGGDEDWYGYPKDHPRMRGEKRECIRWTYELWGSPPHARGKVQRYFGKFLEIRITPACAGKSYNAQKITLNLQDHPRMRGEKHQRKRFLKS